MAKCAACEKLVGAKSGVPPHPDLQFLGTQDYFAGHNTHVERYRCKVCATPWHRDMDKKDAGAIWEVEGKA